MVEQQIVLIFHGLGAARAELPGEEKPYWIAPAFFAEIVDLVARRRDRKQGRPVVFTFDDSNASDLMAAEMLAARGLSGEFYLLSARFGLDHYLSHADTRALCGMGMTIGSHGHAHVDWRGCDDAGLAQELGTARRLIADAAERPVTHAAIPFGAYNRRVRAALAAEGFERVYNSDGGPTRRGSAWARRTCVMGSHRIDDVAAILDDRVSGAQRVRRIVAPAIKRWR